MKEITIVAKDRVGLLADISETLAKSNINISSLSVESTGRTGIVRLMTEDPEGARKELEARQFKVVDANMLVLQLNDKPGELAKIARQLADHGISIENVFLINRENNQTVLAINCSDYEKARKILNI
ncbi:ACT domain-containing protein [Candidatus Micrarchaeota archaeon]|nr:ACT domain-containing protein [Candidatus Micrarchaeota archaeon]